MFNESLCCRLGEPRGSTGRSLLCFSVSSSSMSLIVQMKTNNTTSRSWGGAQSLRPAWLCLRSQHKNKAQLLAFLLIFKHHNIVIALIKLFLASFAVIYMFYFNSNAQCFDPVLGSIFSHMSWSFAHFTLKRLSDCKMKKLSYLSINIKWCITQQGNP